MDIIGHSWGGDTAARVATDNPDRINNLITVDPVTTFSSPPDFGAVSGSVNNWVNVYHSGSISNGGDLVAASGTWGNATYGFADSTIPASQPHEKFDAMLDTPSLSGKTPRQILNSGH